MAPMRAGKVFAAISAFGLFFQIATTPAFAVSCTQQGGVCAAWAVGPNASYKAACAKEIGACKARCKQGQKYFLGVYSGAGGGQQYPIDTCN